MKGLKKNGYGMTECCRKKNGGKPCEGETHARFAQNILISIQKASDAIAKAITSDKSLISNVHKEIGIYSCLFFI